MTNIFSYAILFKWFTLCEKYTIWRLVRFRTFNKCYISNIFINKENTIKTFVCFTVIWERILSHLFPLLLSFLCALSQNQRQEFNNHMHLRTVLMLLNNMRATFLLTLESLCNRTSYCLKLYFWSETFSVWRVLLKLWDAFWDVENGMID